VCICGSPIQILIIQFNALESLFQCEQIVNVCRENSSRQFLDSRRSVFPVFGHFSMTGEIGLSAEAIVK